jgi:hypothetical protein
MLRCVPKNCSVTVWFMGSEPEFSSADLAYVRAEYRTAAELCSGRQETPDWLGGAIDRGKLPHPTYTLPDGAQMFPPTSSSCPTTRAT